MLGFDSPLAARSSTQAITAVVRWHEGSVAARDLIQLSVAATSDACPGAWATDWRVSVAETQFQATGLLPGRCYRWQVVATGIDGTSTATATSGPVWVLPTWTGRLNLYRPGIFSTQATYSYCVPASAQMALNIARARQVHAGAEQAVFYRYGRAHDLYRYAAPGLDPAGAIALMRGLGNEPSYHEVRTRSFASMLKIAVLRMRLTGRPVILFVGNASHAWLLLADHWDPNPSV